MERNDNYEAHQMLDERPAMNVGNWFLTIFLQAIPVVGIVFLFIWAFGDDQPIDRSNYAKASLAWLGITMVFALLGLGVWFMIAATLGLC